MNKLFIILIALPVFSCNQQQLESSSDSSNSSINISEASEEVASEESTEVYQSEDPLLTEEQRVNLEAFIEAVKLLDKEKIADCMIFPFEMNHPVPAIKDKVDFLGRFDEVFDEALIKTIIESSVDSDYSEVGWRGIMLNHGTLWFTESGLLFATNHQTDAEKKHQERLIAQIKTTLHESIRDFMNPVTVIETNKFRVRIDEIEANKYRYASWPLDNGINEKPDLIIENGNRQADGTGGNHRYIFENGKYSYTIWINVIGPDEVPPASLEIKKDGEQILDQDGIIIS